MIASTLAKNAPTKPHASVSGTNTGPTTNNVPIVASNLNGYAATKGQLIALPTVFTLEVGSAVSLRGRLLWGRGPLVPELAAVSHFPENPLAGMWHPAQATRPVCPAIPSDSGLPSLSVSRRGPEKDLS